MSKPYKKREQLTRLGLPGAGSREYTTWEGMVARCTKPTNSRYPRYGGRGITVCERWMQFSNFYADMGPRPDGTTLDRIDNDKGYSPENCQWATRHEQQSNTIRNRWIEMDGERLTLAQWGRRYGIKSSLIRSRMKEMGWSLEQAIKTPIAQWTPERRARQAERMLAAVAVREQRRRTNHQ